MKNLVGETIPASHYKGIEIVGGALEFLEDRLVFKPHAFNFQKGTVEIPYGSITGVLKKRTLGIVPNGLLFLTADGQEHYFFMAGRSDVFDFILGRMGRL